MIFCKVSTEITLLSWVDINLPSAFKQMKVQRVTILIVFPCCNKRNQGIFLMWFWRKRVSAKTHFCYYNKGITDARSSLGWYSVKHTSMSRMYADWPHDDNLEYSCSVPELQWIEWKQTEWKKIETMESKREQVQVFWTCDLQRSCKNTGCHLPTVWLTPLQNT